MYDSVDKYFVRRLGVFGGVAVMIKRRMWQMISIGGRGISVMIGGLGDWE